MLCWLISLFIIPHIFVFVKYFFQVFSKTFLWWFLLWKQLNYYITTSFICQPLFRSFSNLFCCDVVFLSDNLIIIPLPNGFVKCFLQSFQKNFCRLVSQSPESSLFRIFPLPFDSFIIISQKNPIVNNRVSLSFLRFSHVFCRILPIM